MINPKNCPSCMSSQAKFDDVTQSMQEEQDALREENERLKGWLLECISPQRLAELEADHESP